MWASASNSFGVIYHDQKVIIAHAHYERQSPSSLKIFYFSKADTHSNIYGIIYMIAQILVF